MPRPPRLHVPGGFYHVMLRGNHREALFDSPGDRKVLNIIVAEVIDRCEARVHAFCWMTNHLHAIVQVSDKPLGNVVQRIAQRYSRYRHKKLKTGGHLFERRYGAKLVDINAYFLTLLRYIHFNPVKARIVDDPADYPWCSHSAFIGTETIPWLSTDFALSLFSNDLARARAAYARFMLEQVDDGPQDLADESHPDDSRVIGTDAFVARIPLAQDVSRNTLTLEQLAGDVSVEYGTTVDLLRSRLRTRTISSARADLARLAIAGRVATLSEVARFLRRNPSSLTRLLDRHGVAGKWQK